MRAGRLNKRVEIRTAQETNTLGVVTTTFPSSTRRGVRWAEQRGLSVAERYRAQQIDADVDYVFMFRNDSVTRTIIPKDRLLIGATSGTHAWFDIRGVYDPDGRRKAITVLASERHIG